MAKPCARDLFWYRFWVNQTLWKSPRTLTGDALAAESDPQMARLDADFGLLAVTGDGVQWIDADVFVTTRSL
jgi:hypothetical protein